MAAVLVQVVLNGLTLGALYALMAIGLSLIFGIMGVVNLSHGSLLIMAAFVTYTLYHWLAGNVLVAATSSILLVFVLGMVIEKFSVYPVRVSELKVLVTTFGVGKILEQVIYLIWGPTYVTSPVYVSGTLSFFGVSIGLYQLMVFMLGVTLIALLWIFIQKSRLGKAIRAIAQDEEAALIHGVDVKWIRTLTFALASALAAIAGIFLGSIYMFHSASGWEYLLIALSITIVGGLGDIRGAILASFLVGVIEACIGYFISPIWRTTVYFVLIIVILATKPSGLIRLIVKG
ncbi:MAG: branched-chain amino acid ABC transporter permease [Candidatus Nezhaarchaeota archaeon]|nr:branched-chain amino acid ABC transporter permease [Candidatus Nezhaarchaeota archaeon]